MKKNDNLQVLGKTTYSYKIFMPIFAFVMLVVMIFPLLWAITIEEERIFIIMFSILMGMLLLLALTSVVMPINAVVYDKDKKVFIIRAGNAIIFQSYKKRIIPFNQIKNIYATDGNFITPGKLNVITNGKAFTFRTVRSNQEVAAMMDRILKEEHENIQRNLNTPPPPNFLMILLRNNITA